MAPQKPIEWKNPDAVTWGHLNVGLVVLIGNFERVELDVLLYGWLVVAPSNQTLDVEDCVLGIGRQLVLGRIADQSLALRGEGNVRRCDAVALVIGNDLHATVLEHPDTVITIITTITLIIIVHHLLLEHRQDGMMQLLWSFTNISTQQLLTLPHWNHTHTQYSNSNTWTANIFYGPITCLPSAINRQACFGSLYIFMYYITKNYYTNIWHIILRLIVFLSFDKLILTRSKLFQDQCL